MCTSGCLKKKTRVIEFYGTIGMDFGGNFPINFHCHYIYFFLTPDIAIKIEKTRASSKGKVSLKKAKFPYPENHISCIWFLVSGQVG